FYFFFSSRRRHTRSYGDWSSDVCSSDLFPGPAHARGKWFTIDIHCHLRSDKAAAMVAGNDAVSRWFLETAANERSQSINRQNGERTHLQGMSAEQRIADMDHMGIDSQAVSPVPRQTYYG